ncbi:hypothetical protein [Nocardia sp. CNY236]|uniref:hypothetical protein n=1 Tax=Nocardia sp. CNY236 TaxID=1169152 RepID=UPI00056BDB9F|nr:hypothetical protein [Nocardia sp. CNY236]
MFAAVLTCLTVAGLALTAACTTTTTTQAGTDPASSSYRDHLARPGSLEKLAETDAARTLDPCGMLDENALEMVGRPVYFGVGGLLDDCLVKFDPNDLTKGITKIEMSLSVMMGVPELEINGRAASLIGAPGQSCSIALEYNEHRSFFYTAWPIEGADACPVLLEVVTASAPLLDHNPLRVNSSRIPQTVGATIDLCKAIDLAFPNQKVYVAAFDPFECDFWLGRQTRDDSTRYTVRVQPMTVSGSTYVFPEERKLRIVGVDAVEDSGSGDYCKIRANVGAAEPFLGYNRSEPEEHIEALLVSGHGCTETRRLTAAAVRIYQQGA